MQTINAKCHCGLANFTYNLPSSAFPLKSAVCSCNSCRHVTGQIFVTFAVIPAPLPDVSALTEYRSSSTIRRYFCPRCGASVCNVEKDEWEFATGMLDNTEGILNRVQLFTEDTRDGGAAPWLAYAVPEMHMQHRDSKTLTPEDLKAFVIEAPLVKTITGECHCGQVSLRIIPGKYKAELDACTSCRKVSGFEIISWATIPQRNITMANGEDLRFDGMGHYKSSENVDRYFCSGCGATVFWLQDGRDNIDIGVGLLRGSGARAEEILEWHKDEELVSYAEDAIDRPFVRLLADGVRKDRHV